MLHSVFSITSVFSGNESYDFFNELSAVCRSCFVACKRRCTSISICMSWRNRHSMAEAQLHYLGGRRVEGRFVLYPHFFEEILRLDQHIFSIRVYFGYFVVCPEGIYGWRLCRNLLLLYVSLSSLANLSETISLQIDHPCVYTFVLSHHCYLDSLFLSLFSLLFLLTESLLLLSLSPLTPITPSSPTSFFRSSFPFLICFSVTSHSDLTRPRCP